MLVWDAHIDSSCSCGAQLESLKVCGRYWNAGAVFSASWLGSGTRRSATQKRLGPATRVSALPHTALDVSAPHQASRQNMPVPALPGGMCHMVLVHAPGFSPQDHGAGSTMRVSDADLWICGPLGIFAQEVLRRYSVWQAVSTAGVFGGGRVKSPRMPL
jgi:hypothetical protein